jgi:two-component system chemotaxis sensor kinase CheA
VERIAATVLATAADDLPGLAAIHTCFQQVSREANGVAASDLQVSIARIAHDGEMLIERIMLNEVEDATAALRSVSELVKDLQQALSGNPVAPPRPKAGAATAPVIAAPAAASAHEIESELALNPEDVPLAVEFLNEAQGHIEAAEANLLRLEDDDKDPEAVNAIFRAFHTIKGVAGFLNLKQIGTLAHGAESLLDLARKGRLELSGVAVDLVFESIDQLKILLAALDVAVKAGTPVAIQPQLPGLLSRLREKAAHPTGDSAAAAAPAAAAPAATAAPIATAPAATVAPIATAPAQPSAAPLVAAGAVAASSKVPERTEAAASPVTPPASAQPNSARSEAAQSESTVKVSTERLDSLINMVGELVITQSMVSQGVTGLAANDHQVLRNLQHLGKITRELQGLSMAMRMIPISGVFQKMARVVRDLSRKAGKQVDFIVTGGETELDRNVVEAIGDPLVHMVRKSVDHGIEPVDQRLAVGKTRAGAVHLRARHQAGQIVIEISDDGRGLNKERILRKAIEAGLVKETDTLSEQQIFQLIFHAGLSTAEKVTDVSGRGVGMDVVRRNIEALRGRIDIQSTLGKGTTFTIYLPLTLAVIDGLIVRVGSERYIIPIMSIEQSIRPKPDQLSTVQSRGEVCLVRGRVLPLARLHRLFDVKPRTENPAESLVVIVHDHQRHCCLLVDELLGQQQVVIKSLGESIGTLRGVSGGAILGDGSISLILDVPGLIDLAWGH